MKRLLCLVAMAASVGCDRGAAKGVPPPAKAPLTDAQAAEAEWRTWTSKLKAGDARGAWECLSKRSRAERAALYRADAARIRALSGTALEAESRAWGTSPASLSGASADDLAVLALARESARPDGGERSPEITSVKISGGVALVLFTGSRGPAALVLEEGRWRLDDLESRKAAGH